MRPHILVERLSKSIARPGRRAPGQAPSPRANVRSGDLVVLNEVSFAVPRGSFFCIAGRSASGKSTLLSILAGIDLATSGTVTFDGPMPTGTSEDDRARWRARTVGMVFEFFQLLPALSAGDNVRLALQLARCVPRAEWPARVTAALEAVGAAAVADLFPEDLTAGEQQRVAVARALANQPSLLLADEPTGNLDSEETAALLEILASLTGSGLTVIYATHDRELASRASDRIELCDGRVVEQSYGAIPGIYTQ